MIGLTDARTGSLGSMAVRACTWCTAWPCRLTESRILADRYTPRHGSHRDDRDRRPTPTRKLIPIAATLAVAGAFVGGAGYAMTSSGAAAGHTALWQSASLDPGERAAAAERAARNAARTPAPTPSATPSPSAKPSPTAKSKTASSGSVVATGTCEASFYGEGQGTASGEEFDPTALTAAHKTLPFNTRVRVTNVATGKSVIVRINDRGPYVDGRCLDLSTAAFSKIANTSSGVIKVKYEVLRG